MVVNRQRSSSRTLLVALLTALLSGLLTTIVAPSEAAAAVIGDDYPAYLRNAAQDSLVDPWNFYNRECTSFVAWRLNNTNGVGFHNYYAGQHWGNADHWGPAAQAAGITVNMTPAIGAVAWWSSMHVAWVADIGNGTVTIEEYNYGYAGAYHVRTIPAGSVSGYIHVKDLPTNRAPVATLDVAESHPGLIRVRGWAFDPDTPTTPIGLHVYVGGPAGAGEGHDLGAANQSRPDVGAAFPGVGDNHGFDVWFTTGRYGAQPVYLYALDSSGGYNPLFATPTVTVTNPDPIGNYEGADSPTGGAVHVYGWAIDPNTPEPIDVHVYIGGPAGSNAESFALRADVARTDVAATYGWAGPNHGFDHRITTTRRGSQPVYVYAINSPGYPGQNVLLGNRTVVIGDAALTTQTPAITGKILAGAVVTAAPGAWGPAPVTLTYQWLRNGSPITTATATTYTLTNADAGTAISVQVTGSKPGYVTTSKTSTTVTVPPPNATTSFVNAAYQDFLGRQPTPTELTTATTNLDTGTWTRDSFLRTLATSPEWVRVIVTRMYRDTLGRDPDPTGLNTWVDWIRTGRFTVAQAATLFYSSQEFYQGLGGNTPTSWVTTLYDKLLHRAPDPTGLTLWASYTSNPSYGPTWVASQFYQSLESRMTRVNTLYTTLLGRTADPTGLTYWANTILTSGDIQLAINLANSTEYTLRAQTRY